MKPIFITLLCIYAAIDSYSQWSIVFENDKSVRDILFIDKQKGFAISSDKLISTVDSGNTWTSVLYDGVDDGLFNDIAFPSHDTGYVVANGSEGPLYTHDAGETWQYKYTLPFTDMNASCVSMINNDVGYTGTDGPSFRFTTDGFATETGGGITSSGDYFKSIYFLDLDTGYAGTLYYMFKTTNAGLDWETIYPEGLGPNEIHFINPQIGYYIDNLRLYKSINYGKNWDSIPIPVSFPRILNGFTILGTDTIYIGGNDYEKPFICRSFDGGSTWTFTEIDEDVSDYLYTTVTDFYCFDAYNCFATVGPFGAILKTNNAGGIAYLNNQPQVTNFYIYPNPASSNITISYKNKEEIKTITTTNYLGEKIDISFDVDLTADISALPAGIYFTQIITEQGKGVQKWIKM